MSDLDAVTRNREAWNGKSDDYQSAHAAQLDTRPLAWGGMGHDRPSTTLTHDYYGLHQVEEGDGSSTFVLGYGDWIRLFRRCGLVVDDLIELRPSDGATTTYGDFVPFEWARRWPAEAIWVTRRT